MEHFIYHTTNTCCKCIEFDLSEDHKLHNVSFTSGCPGNLKAISILIEGKDAKEIERLLKGNKCGERPTSCSDQLSHAIRKATKKWIKKRII
jgi:uncharacterized protein (TIGR03905 family)